MSEGGPRQRLDKWLWHARFGRTRTRSAALVRSGYVRLNGQRVTEADKPVGPGDVLTIAMPGRTWLIRITAMTDHRGNADCAAQLYELAANGGPGNSPAR